MLVMIRKLKGGYKVYSKKGKPLSKKIKKLPSTLKKNKAAQKRLMKKSTGTTKG